MQQDFLEVNGKTEEFVRERARKELNYTTRESLYNDKTNTAYVLIKMKKDTPGNDKKVNAPLRDFSPWNRTYSYFNIP